MAKPMQKPNKGVEPEKMPLVSMDVAAEKLERLKSLFPEAFKEGNVDFDQLKRSLGEWVDAGKERFGLNWPGKADCMKIIQQPSVATLRPLRDESIAFDTTGNIYIEGDNLEVLKLLQKSYFGKVKMIYIDPPYNTGKEFIYPDKYQEGLNTYLAYTGQIDDEGKKFSTNSDTSGRYHSNWLTMMYPRLYLARNLLDETGYICISIGEDEVANLRELGNEVFGEENFINCVSVFSKVSAGASGGGEDKRLKKNVEYILIFAKNLESMNDVSHMYSTRPLISVIEEMRNAGESWKYTSILIDKGKRTFFKEIKDGDGNPIQIFKCAGVKRSTIKQVMKNEGLSEKAAYDKYFESIFSDTNAQTSIRTRVMDAVGNLADEEMLEVEYTPRTGKDKGKKVVHGYVSNTVRRVIWLSDVSERGNGEILKRDKVGTLWDDFDYNNLGKEGGVPFPNGKKPIKLIQRCLQISKETDGIVLDFFGGSASTGHAVLQQNIEDNGSRKFILVQLPENIDPSDDSQEAVLEFCKENKVKPVISALGRERLSRVIKGLESAPDLLSNKKFIDGLGFRSYALSSSNFKVWDGSPDGVEMQLALHVDHIAPKSSQEDILYELLMKAGFPLTTRVEKVKLAGKQIFSIEEGALLICLENEITDELIDALVDANPVQVICLDAAFKGNDQLKTNAVQTFKSRAQSKEQEIVFRTV